LALIHKNISESVIGELIANGADVNKRDAEGLAPLHILFRDEKIGLMQYEKLCSKRNILPYFLGKQRLPSDTSKRCKSFDLLLNTPNIDVNISEGFAGSKFTTPLSYAMHLKEYSIAKKLIFEFADVTSVNLEEIPFGRGIGEVLVMLSELGVRDMSLFFERKDVVSAIRNMSGFMSSHSLRKELLYAKQLIQSRSKSVQPLLKLTAVELRHILPRPALKRLCYSPRVERYLNQVDF